MTHTKMTHILTTLQSTTFIAIAFAVILFTKYGNCISVMPPSISYCDWQFFNVSCPQREIIKIKSAKYGRMSIGKCVRKDYGHVGCETDILNVFSSMCSLKRTCLVSVISLHRYSTKCPADFKSYLQASYRCEKVQSSRLPGCRRSLKASPDYQYVMATSTGSNCTWSIYGQSYQRLAISVSYVVVPIERFRSGYHNFDGGGGGGGGGAIAGALGRTSIASRCNRIALITELLKNTTKKAYLCSNEISDKRVYVSTGNRVNMTLSNPAGLRYTISFKAFGCRDLVLPSGSSVGQHSTYRNPKAVVHCNDSLKRWTVTCSSNGYWLGYLGNCSRPAAIPLEKRVQWSFVDVMIGNRRLPFGMLMIVTMGVALGVSIGVILLFTVLSIFKRRRKLSASRSSFYLQELQREGTLASGANKSGEDTLSKHTVDTDVTDLSMRDRPLPCQPASVGGGGGGQHCCHTLARHNSSCSRANSDTMRRSTTICASGGGGGGMDSGQFTPFYFKLDRLA